MITQHRLLRYIYMRWLVRSHLVLTTHPSPCFFTATDIVKNISYQGLVSYSLLWEKAALRKKELQSFITHIKYFTCSFLQYISDDKLLIVFPLSRMCCLCLTLPPPHDRWYNGCHESRNHFHDGQNRISVPKAGEKRTEILLAIVLLWHHKSYSSYNSVN